jgi:hypothetical protein
METECFSEMLVSTHESTQHHNPEEHHRHDDKPSGSIKARNFLTS